MPVRTIMPAEVDHARSRDADVELLDVRTAAEFRQVHANGARSMPIGELDVTAFLNQRAQPRERPIYLLCKSGGRATKAAEKFAAAGFENALVVEGGTDAWVRAGLPVERGTSRVISIERQVRIAAGALVLIGSVLAWAVHPAFLILPAFVGSGLLFAGTTDWCGMGLLLAECRGIDKRHSECFRKTIAFYFTVIRHTSHCPPRLLRK